MTPLCGLTAGDLNEHVHDLILGESALGFGLALDGTEEIALQTEWRPRFAV